MKILYIYRDYKGRRKAYGKMMSQCGHKVSYLQILEKKIKNQVNIKHIKKYNPDLVWVYTPYYISRKVISDETIGYLKKKGIPIAMYSTIDPERPWHEDMDTWRKIDFLFIHYKPFFQFLKKEGLNAYYSPLGFYPDQYYKTIAPKKKIDVSFMGTAQIYLPVSEDKRVRYLKSLSRHNLSVHGEGFAGRLSGSHSKFRGHDIQRKIYSKSKINLDLPFVNYKHPFYKDQIHFKNRFFEIPATGNFLLALRCPEFLEIFNEDTIGYYDDNIDSLKESVKRYLKDKSLRQKMAEKAYNLVHQKYTYLHRFKDMFKIIKR